jgi:hypothetical protein
LSKINRPVIFVGLEEHKCECDGCKHEYRDRETFPCTLCNRNYELYSDRYATVEDEADDCEDTREHLLRVMDEDYWEVESFNSLSEEEGD